MDELSAALLSAFKDCPTLTINDISRILSDSPNRVSDTIEFLINKNYLRIETNYSAINGTKLQYDTPIEITHAGRVGLWNHIQSQKVKSKKERQTSRRYWITTGIAIAALIKAFLPELTVVLEWLLKLLKQQ